MATVREAVSNSGYRTQGMTLRASYTAATKKATLVHELGHRLQGDLFRQDEEEHEYLFLWLYDVWHDLYGAEFADAQVKVERSRGARYERAWGAALSLSREDRAQRWRALVESRQ